MSIVLIYVFYFINPLACYLEIYRSGRNLLFSFLILNIVSPRHLERLLLDIQQLTIHRR